MRRIVMVFQMLLTKMVSALECTSNSNGSSSLPFQSLPSAVALRLNGYVIHFKKISLAFVEENAKALILTACLHFESKFEIILFLLWEELRSGVIHLRSLSKKKGKRENMMKKVRCEIVRTITKPQNKDTCTNGSSARSSSWPSRPFFFTWSSHKGADWWPVSGCPTHTSQRVHSWHKVQNYIFTVVMDCKNNNNWEQAKTVWKYAFSSWHSNCFCMFLKRKCYSEHFLISVAPKWKGHFWNYSQITAGC